MRNWLAWKYRQIFYYWRAKYLCGWLGWHEKPEGWEKWTSYTCRQCGCTQVNWKHPLNQ